MHKLGNSNTFAAVRVNVSIRDRNNFGKDSVFNLRGTEDQFCYFSYAGSYVNWGNGVGIGEVALYGGTTPDPL